MGLTPEQIKSLLAKKPRRGGSTGPRKGKADTSIRDYQTWFKLQHQMFDLETNIDVQCDNPDCSDPRPPKKTAMGNAIRVQACAVVSGRNMCRYCYMSGWLLSDPSQLELVND